MPPSGTDSAGAHGRPARGRLPVVRLAVPDGSLVIALSAGGALVALSIVSRRNYLLFHAFAELVSITVAFGVFVIAWNSRRFAQNSYLLFLGMALPVAALVALLHTLAYKGMGVFAEASTNLPTQLWIARRYLEASAYLGAALSIGRRVRPGLVLGGYTAAAATLVAAIFWWQAFPVCHIEGRGLTPFKIASEYAICIVLAIALATLVQKRQCVDRRVLGLLAAAILASIAAGFCFTAYVHVYGQANQVGHLLGVLSVYLVYLAIIGTCFSDPYQLLFRELKQSEEDLRQARARLQAAYEREHRIAASFQSTLLIKEHTQIPGYETAGLYRPALLREADVGGDFYNLFPLGDQHTGLVIGDVAGKGLEAAVVAARVQQALMSLAFAGQSPGEALTTLRRIVSVDDPDQIITVFFGVLTRETGRLEWASAGHEPAVIVRASTRQVELLYASGPPLFGMDLGSYRTSTVSLAPGDCLLLYTDGLPEAHAGPNSELLGEERVAELVQQHCCDAPDAIVDLMVAAAQEQSRGRLHDDIALLLVRRASMAPGSPAANGAMPAGLPGFTPIAPPD